MKNRTTPKFIKYPIYWLFDFLPDKVALKLLYFIKTGRFPNLKDPRRFTEKIQLYKLNYRNEVMHKCVDKYNVRQYVESKGLGDILNKLYGVYDDVSQIDFDTLPQKFVIKTTDGAGGNNIYICKDKQKADWHTIKSEIVKWRSKKSLNPGREWAYTAIPKSQYIVEEYLENDKDSGELIDYKFFCFNGKVEYLYIIADRDIGTDCALAIFNWSFEKIDAYRVDERPLNKSIDKPANFNEMIRIAELLSADFPHVRVDLYNVNNKIIFGEFTFYDGSGNQSYSPDSFDFTLGEQFDVSSFFNQ